MQTDTNRAQTCKHIRIQKHRISSFQRFRKSLNGEYLVAFWLPFINYLATSRVLFIKINHHRSGCFINFGSLAAPFSLHLASLALNFGSILAPFWSSLASIWPPRASPWALWGPFGRQGVPKKGSMSEKLVHWTPPGLQFWSHFWLIFR